MDVYVYSTTTTADQIYIQDQVNYLAECFYFYLILISFTFYGPALTKVVSEMERCKNSFQSSRSISARHFFFLLYFFHFFLFFSLLSFSIGKNIYFQTKYGVGERKWLENVRERNWNEISYLIDARNRGRTCAWLVQANKFAASLEGVQLVKTNRRQVVRAKAKLGMVEIFAADKYNVTSLAEWQLASRRDQCVFTSTLAGLSPAIVALLTNSVWLLSRWEI